jgi:23S rRNA (cytosine1962-C5)-methyltransferase
VGGRQHVVVNSYSAGWLAKGFHWVYPKEIVRGGGRPGDEIEVRSEQGKVLGRGLRDDGWIAVRVFRHEDAPLDDSWLHRTLERAAALREVVVDSETTGFRLVNAESDGLPGIRVDRWAHFFVITLDTPSVAPLVPRVVSWLEARFQPRGVYLCYRLDSRETRTGELKPAAGLISGHPAADDVRVTERGVSFLVRPGEGPDVGLYADMRETRAWMEPHWGGKRVLNTFAFTGAFSVVAALNGASEVVTVDLSAKYLDRFERNLRANELEPADHEIIEDDTFKALDRLRRTGREFDCIILDPPAFSHSPAGTWSVRSDYQRLIAAACRVLAPDGWLICATNLGEMSPRDFRGQIQQGTRKVGRQALELLWGGQSADFPAALDFPEARYLKVGVYRVG